MTHAFGGGGDLTLATLYVPVKPETRGLHEDMVRVGEEAGRGLVAGLNTSGLASLGASMALGFEKSMPPGFSHGFGELSQQLDHLGEGALTAQSAFDRYTNSMRMTSEAANRTHSEETKLLNLRNQGTNVAAQIAAQEALIAEHYRRGGEGSKALQKEETNLQNMRTKGNNLATQIVVQEGQLSNAQMLHTQRTQESATAHERYNQALEQTHSHLNLAAVGTAAMTGAVTGLTFAAVNLVSEGLGAMVHGFEDIVKAGAGVVDSVINIGQHFQDLNRQVRLFTTESGPALQGLQDSMRNVYANLDVPAGKLGETFGVLHQQFGFTGDGLEKISYHLTELGARFGQIDIREFSAAMHQFGIDGVEPVDRALGQLIFDSEKYGITIQSLQNSMVQMGPIFDALGINYNSAAMAVSRIEQLGDPARRVMLGLSATAKEMAKGPDPKGTFKQYMADVITTGQNLKKAGGDQLADAFAQSEFSVRNWAILQQTYGIMQDAINDVGKEGDNIDLDKLILDTRTLHEKFRLFLDDVEARLAPLGLDIVAHISGGLDQVKHWFDSNQPMIIGKIKEWGDKFIDNIPQIQHFVGEAVKFIGDFTTFAVRSFGYVTEVMGMLFGNEQLEEFGRKITNFDMRPLTDKIGNAIETGFHIDTHALKEWWDGHAIPDLVKNQPKIDIQTDLKTPDGKSLLGDKMQDTAEKAGEKIGEGLVKGIEKGATEHIPGWLKVLITPFGAHIDDNTPDQGETDQWRKDHGWPVDPHAPDSGAPQVSPGGEAPGSPWSSGAAVDPGSGSPPPAVHWENGPNGTPGKYVPGPPGTSTPQMPATPGFGQHWEDGKGWVTGPWQAQTSGFTEPVDNAPTVLAGTYDPAPHAHENAAAPAGIGAPTWPGMGRGGRSGGKDPALQEQERQDRLDNAHDTLDDATDSYKDAQTSLKVSTDKNQPLIDQYTRDIAAMPAGPLRKEYEEKLEAATTELTKARHAATHSLHAKDRAERGLTEAQTKSDEPGKGDKGDDANMQRLGQSIIPGLMQEMGFGDVFGKAPNEWGAFKMLGGALQWALKAANTIGGAGFRLGPHGLYKPAASGAAASAPGVVGPPEEVSPFGPNRGLAPGPGDTPGSAPGTFWGEPVSPQTDQRRSFWGQQYPWLQPTTIPHGTALASATQPTRPSIPATMAAANMPAGNIPASGGPGQPGEEHLQPGSVALRRAIFQQFPEIKDIGGFRADSLQWHPSGRALDVMIPGQGGLNDPTTPEGLAEGNRIYSWLQSNAATYGVQMDGTLWQKPDHHNHIHVQLAGPMPQPRPQGFQAGGLVGFDDGGPVVRYPEGGTKQWDTSHTSPSGHQPWFSGFSGQRPSGPVARYSGPQSWDNPHSPPSGHLDQSLSHPAMYMPPPMGIPAVASGPSGHHPWFSGFGGSGTGYRGAGFQPGGGWLKSQETTGIGSHYKIKSGDTLSDIAQRSGVSISAIQQANNIADPNMINADAILKLPGGRGWFGTPASGEPVASTPSSGFSTQLPIKLPPRPAGPPVVIPMSPNRGFGKDDWQQNPGPPRDSSILGKLLGLGDHQDDGDHQDSDGDSILGFGGLNPFLRGLLGQGFQHGGKVLGFAHGGVVGFDQGGGVGDNNFYKQWYPRSQTPTATTPMLHPDGLGGLLGGADAHPTATAPAPSAAQRPWGVKTQPWAPPVAPLPGFRSQADEQRATGFGRVSRAVSGFSAGILPDVAEDYNTLTHWGQHTGMEQTGAVLDTASMIPGLGTLLGKGAGLGARELGVAGRPLIERLGAKNIGDAASLAYWRLGDPVQRWAERSLAGPGIFGGLPNEFRVAGGAGAARREGFDPEIGGRGREMFKVDSPPLGDEAFDPSLVNYWKGVQREAKDPMRVQYQKYADFGNKRWEEQRKKGGYLLAGDNPDVMPFEEWVKLQNEADVGDWNIAEDNPAPVFGRHDLRRNDEVPAANLPAPADLAALRSTVRKPTSSLKGGDYFMRQFNSPWSHSYPFQLMQPGITEGIHGAFAGEPGGITDEIMEALNDWDARAPEYNNLDDLRANTPPEVYDAIRAFGNEIGSRMVHSSPTKAPIYRGASMSAEQSEALHEGQILSKTRPLSFGTKIGAESAARYRSPWQHNYEDMMTLPQRMVPDDEGRMRVMPGWDPILYRLDEGSQIGDVSNTYLNRSEQLGMGDFQITDLQRGTFNDPLTRVRLQQLGLQPGTGFAFGGMATTDTIPAMLTPGEVVLNKRAVDVIGLDNALGINALGLADGGMVPVTPSAGPNIQASPGMEQFKQDSLSGALGGISSIMSGLGADFNPKQWQGLLQPPEPRQSAVYYNNSIHITGNTIADPKQQQAAQQDRWNSRFETTTGGLPMPSVGAP